MPRLTLAHSFRKSCDALEEAARPCWAVDAFEAELAVKGHSAHLRIRDDAARRMAGADPAAHGYAHVVVDEAQDLPPPPRGSRSLLRGRSPYVDGRPSEHAGSPPSWTASGAGWSRACAPPGSRAGPRVPPRHLERQAEPLPAASPGARVQPPHPPQLSRPLALSWGRSSSAQETGVPSPGSAKRTMPSAVIGPGAKARAIIHQPMASWTPWRSSSTRIQASAAHTATDTPQQNATQRSSRLMPHPRRLRLWRRSPGAAPEHPTPSAVVGGPAAVGFRRGSGAPPVRPSRAGAAARPLGSVSSRTHSSKAAGVWNAAP